MDVIDRLHLAVKASTKSKKEIARDAGMTRYQLSRLLNHRLESPSIYDIEAVARAIDLSMEALYAEERDTAAEVVQAREALQVLGVFIDRHDQALAKKPAAIPKKKMASRRARPFPVAATPNVELFDGGEAPRRDIPDALWERGARYAAKAIGDSMIDAGIDSGDVVFFRQPTSIAAARGKIVVCRYGAGVYLKRLEKVGEGIRLLSENERYKPIVVGEGEEFELYGVVVLPARGELK